MLHISEGANIATAGRTYISPKLHSVVPTKRNNHDYSFRRYVCFWLLVCCGLRSPSQILIGKSFLKNTFIKVSPKRNFLT